MNERDELEHIQQTRGWAVQHLLLNRTELNVDEVITEAKKLAQFCLHVEPAEMEALKSIRTEQDDMTISYQKKRAEQYKADFANMNEAGNA